MEYVDHRKVETLHTIPLCQEAHTLELCCGNKLEVNEINALNTWGMAILRDISEECDEFSEFWKHLWGLQRDCIFVGWVEAVPGVDLCATNVSVLAHAIMTPVLSSQLALFCFLNCVITYWFDSISEVSTLGLGFLWNSRGEWCKEILAEFTACILKEHWESVKGLSDNHLLVIC